MLSTEVLILTDYKAGHLPVLRDSSCGLHQKQPLAVAAISVGIFTFYLAILTCWLIFIALINPRILSPWVWASLSLIMTPLLLQ